MGGSRHAAPDSPSLLVIHPFLPTYRRPFFDRLHDALAAQGWNFGVADSEAPPTIAGRDDTSRGDWVVPTRTRWIRVAGRDVAVRKPPTHVNGHPVTHVIVQQELRNLETYPLVGRHLATGSPLAMWGQGRSYSTPQGPALAAAKQWLTRRGDWFFAYTQAGADHVISHGFPATRVTVLNNTIDTDSLRADLAAVSEADIQAFSRKHGLSPGRTALFLGGVDKSKGIDFLLEAAEIAARILPGFVLLVGGAGAQLGDVQTAQRKGAPVRALGRLDGQDKALALRSAEVLAIPEWIGLVAVDSLVAGRPIVTTLHASHSPEHEYLEPGVTAVATDHRVDAYALALTEVMDSAETLLKLQLACLAEAPKYSQDLMVSSFVEGVMAWDDVRRAGL